MRSQFPTDDEDDAEPETLPAFAGAVMVLAMAAVLIAGVTHVRRLRAEQTAAAGDGGKLSGVMIPAETQHDEMRAPCGGQKDLSGEMGQKTAHTPQGVPSVMTGQPLNRKTNR